MTRPTALLATACVHLTLSLSLLLSTVLVGCKGGDGSSTDTGAAPPPVAKASPGGAYVGRLHSDVAAATYIVGAAVGEGGELQIVNIDTGYQYSGRLSTTGTGANNASAALRVYSDTGAYLGTGAFTGTVTERRQIVGTYTTAGGDRGSLTADYSKADYERPITLTALAGTYHGIGPRSNGDVTLTLSPDGAFTGLDENGCTVSGTVRIPDARFDLLDVTLSIAPTAGCPAATLTGLGTYSPAGGADPASLALAVSGASVAYFADYRRTADPA